LFAFCYEWTWIPQTTFFVLFVITAISFAWLHFTVMKILRQATPELTHKFELSQ
jgi:NNP family nitrate/nitrite transporter-like MFS transporter